MNSMGSGMSTQPNPAALRGGENYNLGSVLFPPALQNMAMLGQTLSAPILAELLRFQTKHPFLDMSGQPITTLDQVKSVIQQLNISLPDQARLLSALKDPEFRKSVTDPDQAATAEPFQAFAARKIGLPVSKELPEDSVAVHSKPGPKPNPDGNRATQVAVGLARTGDNALEGAKTRRPYPGASPESTSPEPKNGGVMVVGLGGAYYLSQQIKARAV